MKAVRRKRAEVKRLAAMKHDEIDTSDIPEITDWSQAQVGRFYRPVKKQITLRIDADVLAWFKARGPGYQSEINRELRNCIVKSGSFVNGRKLSAKTGEACPESGLWMVEGSPSASVSVSKGKPMPPLANKKVIWTRRRAA